MKTGRKLTNDEKSRCLGVIAKILRRQLDDCGYEQYDCIRHCLGYVIGHPPCLGTDEIWMGEQTPIRFNTEVVMKMLK